MTPPGVATRSGESPPSDGAPPRHACPACGRPALDVFFEQHRVPVTSNASFRTRDEALACVRGEMRLAFCHGCGMIANTAFEEQPIATECETSQATSPRFQQYVSDLARTWIERYGLQGGTVLEIGCARGEFLQTLVQHGAARGIGIDPVLANEQPAHDAQITFIGEPFRVDHLDDSVRAVVCRHTLEHIPDAGTFLRTLRAAIGSRDVVALFEVPDVERILREGAVHDIYYEHCSYFSAGSLQRAFREAGFDILRIDRTFAGQYLVIEARAAVDPSTTSAGLPLATDDASHLWREAQTLSAGYGRRIAQMEDTLRAAREARERVVFWGAGSKATAFLGALSTPDSVACVVDINPRKWGTFIAGTGTPVVAPSSLQEVQPGVVVLMNAAYRDEVAAMLEGFGVSARLIGPGVDD